jgi:hypothetical protein
VKCSKRKKHRFFATANFCNMLTATRSRAVRAAVRCICSSMQNRSLLQSAAERGSLTIAQSRPFSSRQWGTIVGGAELKEKEASRARRRVRTKQPATVLPATAEMVNAELARVQRALQRMKADNKVFIVTRKDCELVVDLGPDLGKYFVTFEPSSLTMDLISPRSGRFFYKYNTATK